MKNNKKWLIPVIVIALLVVIIIMVTKKSEKQAVVRRPTFSTVSPNGGSSTVLVKNKTLILMGISGAIHWGMPRRFPQWLITFSWGATSVAGQVLLRLSR